MRKETNRNLILTSDMYLTQKEYWLSKLSGELTKTELLASNTKPGHTPGNGGSLEKSTIHIPQDLFSALIKLSKRNELSLFLVLLSGLKSLIYRYNGNEDIIVKSPLYKMNITEDTLNDYLLIRHPHVGQLTFKELLLEVRQSVFEAYNNQDYPFDNLINFFYNSGQLPDNDSLSNVECLLQNIHDTNGRGFENTDGQLVFSFLLEDSQLKGHIIYNTDIYERFYLEQLSGHLARVLECVVGNIDIRISHISYLSPKEREQLIYHFNHTHSHSHTKRKYRQDLLLHERFTVQAQQSPHRTALVYNHQHLSYDLLNKKANDVGRQLEAKGVKPDCAVGVIFERSLEMITGILGILKAGAAYLPIDPDYPEDRIHFILADSKANALVTTNVLAEEIETVKKWEGEKIFLDLESKLTCAGESRRLSRRCLAITSSAYIIYTSGSTGKPKGVIVEHINALSTLDWFGKAYNIGSGSHVLQAADISFDVSVEEIFATLLFGATLFIPHKQTLLDKIKSISYLEKHDINIVQFVPVMLKHILGEDKKIESLKVVICGGDKLEEPLKDLIISKGYNLYNHYGPTEVTVDAVVSQCRQSKVVIGKPITNVCAYILGKTGHLLPVGVVGELCISGAGLARGYLNDPELTAKKFAPWQPEPRGAGDLLEKAPQSPELYSRPHAPGSRLYYTGDRCFWLPDGNIQFLGRQDHQVKIRGFRIEIDEIENCLLNHHAISEVVVLALENKKNERYLCAYIVSEQELPVSQLREYLFGYLPDYMVPSYFIQIDSVPLTPNGKINRKALASLKIKTEDNYVAPRNPNEEQITGIWSEILAIDRSIIGIESNFFELGGHSLNATILAAKVHKAFNTWLPLAEIFKTPTIKGISEYIQQAEKETFISIEPVEKREYYQLSSQQNRLYIIQQMELSSTAYNLPQAIPLDKNIDSARIEAAFEKLIARHESLRTCFLMLKEVPVQRIQEKVDLAIEYYNTGESGEEKLRGSFIRPFDLGKAPLLRVSMLRGSEASLLLIDMHHIITDGETQSILVREFNVLFNGDPLPPFKLQYKDYAQWQNRQEQKESLKQQESFWLEVLHGELPVLNLPTDYPRPQTQQFDGNSVDFMLDEIETRELKKLTKKQGTTLFMTLLSIFTILLSRLSSQEDIIVGTGVAGRRHADLQEVIGMFVNILAMRNYPAAGKTFDEFLLEVKEKTLQAFENQEYQFEDLVEKVAVRRDAGRNPVVEVIFNVLDQEEYREDMEKADEKEEQPLYKHIKVISKFDKTLLMTDMGKKLLFTLQYSTALFKPDSIERYIGYFRRIVTTVIHNPEVRLGEIEIINEREKKQLLIEFNDTSAEYPSKRTIHELFEEQVEKTPDRVVLVGQNAGSVGKSQGEKAATVWVGRHALTYRVLNEQSNRMAHLLIEKGVRSDTGVGLMMERSLEMIVAILAVLKSGGGYLPIEPSIAEKRVVSMLNDCDVPLLLTGSSEMENYSFSGLLDLNRVRREPVRTSPRAQVKDFDSLPLVDRSLVDYEKYTRFIGQGMVKNSITLQATRGCPYNCAYCCRVWPRTYVKRSAENIFAEVQLYYNMGVRRFVFVDDIFNLDKENSTRFFRLIIESPMQPRILFPSGLRGDLLTKDYIDLMVEAGVMSFPVALETACPRVQKLIRKHLDLEIVRENLEYIMEHHPQLILELHTMHGFPTETEEEAMMTLDFIKSLKGIHFPYVHILRIYPHTHMEELAIAHGISRDAITASMNLAYHQLPETLVFDRNFTLRYQTDFFNNYFLSKNRLKRVLPYQLQVLTEDEIVQKYNSYLPTDIKSLTDLLEFLGITREELGVEGCLDESAVQVDQLNTKLKNYFASLDIPAGNAVQLAGKEDDTPVHDVLRVLLLDVTQEFSSQQRTIYNVVEQPLGLMYLATYLHRELGNKVQAKVAKARIDYDSFEELKKLVHEFKPHLVGIRALTLYKNAFHQTAALLRHWGVQAPIIAGGPYATVDYETLLQDPHVSVAVLGEGELTFKELVGKILENGNKLPSQQVLNTISGIAFVPAATADTHGPNRDRWEIPGRQVLLMDQLNTVLSGKSTTNPDRGRIFPGDLAYIIFTSGSTGKPKGVLTTHTNVIRVVKNTNYIDLTPDDRLLQLSNYAFDGSVFDIYGALLNGASLVVTSREEAMAVDRLAGVIKREAVTVFFVTTALFNTLVDMEIGCFTHTRKVLFGGQRVSVEHARKALAYLGKDRIIHVYGPTETTVYASFYFINQIEASAAAIPIGSPLANTAIYILDKYLSPVPIGLNGEIYIGGTGTARGYLNRPELTAETFVDAVISHSSLVIGSSAKLSPNDQWPMTADRLYKTGDLARWEEDGNIEFLGRTDYQVKIRGFRIEPGEIESQLQKHKNIKETLVLPKEDKSGEKYLCAYIVANPVPTVSELREYLLHILPDYMIPAYFIFVERFPLTPNGKIDYKALPEPGVNARENYVAPRNSIEKKLVRIWSGVLGIEEVSIGIEDDFFELGGHSLKATIMAAKVHKSFNTRLPLAEIFKSPTIKEIARYIQRAEQEKYASLEPVEKREFYTLSSQQKRLYIIQQIVPGSTAYNMPFVIPLNKDTRMEQIEAVFRKLIARHESFRTCFDIVNQVPVQKISGQVEFEIEYYNINGCEATGESHQPSSILHRFVRPFDLNQAPLLRVGLITGAAGERILMMDMHHIINDGTSQLTLEREFMALYKGEELPLPRLRYKDYAQWQNSREQKQLLKQQELYWLDNFKDELPVLNLPFDYPRPTTQDFEGNAVNFELNEQQSRALKDIGKKYDNTLFMTLLAVYTILLSKLSGQEDIIVGTPIAGRRHADLENIIGMFVNTLAVRNYPLAEKTVEEFLLEIKAHSLQAFENQDYQFENLVEKVSVQRDASRNPVFDVLFTLVNLAQYRGDLPAARENKKQSSYRHIKEITKFDLSLSAVEYGEMLLFSLHYSTSLFKPASIDRYIGYFERIAEAVASSPALQIGKIEIISEAEKNQILKDFNDTESGYPSESTIDELFAEQVQRTPDRIAVIGTKYGELLRETALTYRALNERSDHLAWLLKEKGVQSDVIVGLMMERSIEMMVDILAILKAGGAYMPIDPDYPHERKRYMLAESHAAILLTASAAERFERLNPTMEIVEIKEQGFNQREESGRYPDAGVGNLAAAGSLYRYRQLAYVMYTSGSTGSAKGVMVGHRNVIRLVKNTNFVELNQETRILQTGAPVFDATTFEVWGSLLNGGRLVLVKNEVIIDSRRLKRALIGNCINTLWLTSPLFNQLTQQASDIFSGLTYLLVGGDVLSPRYINQVRNENKGLKVINGYGPTENTTFSTCYLIEDDFQEQVPIGHPINNSTAYILDKGGHLQPPGLWGELYVGGDGISRGYLNNPELTAEKFQVTNKAEGYRSSSSNRSYILYRTGDLARWLPDGKIEFLGRLDDQVKIRGFRIEPLEIENHLLRHEGVKEALVLLKKNKNGEKYLCAYIVSNRELLQSELREYLRVYFPDYMIPSYFMPIENIPLTPNGKIDRGALPEPEIKPAEHNIAPRDEVEAHLADIWSEVLGIEKANIGIDSDFFQLGGHSLTAAIMTAKIHNAFNILLPLVEVFKTPTIQELAQYIKGKKTAVVSVKSIDENLVFLKESSNNAANLYFIHEVSGQVGAYMELCNHLTGINCLCITADMNETYIPGQLTIKSLVRKYINNIKKYQPYGPYHIAGWSMGGTLAIEMAGQLEKQEEEIAFLGIIDAPIPQKPLLKRKYRYTLENEINTVNNWLRWENIDEITTGEINEVLSQVTEVQQVWPSLFDYFADEENTIGLELVKSLFPLHISPLIPNFNKMSIKELFNHYMLIRCISIDLGDYTSFKKLKTQMHFFSPTMSSKKNLEGWRKYCRKPINNYMVSGDHFSMMTGPGVEEIAKIIETIYGLK